MKTKKFFPFILLALCLAGCDGNKESENNKPTPTPVTPVSFSTKDGEMSDATHGSFELD